MQKKIQTATRSFHTPKTQKGSGDYYGTGIKNPVAKPREIMGIKSSKKASLSKPPRSLA